MTNIEWIKKGSTGCTFVTLFSKNPDKIGWRFYHFYEWMENRNKWNENIISIEFPSCMNKEQIKDWALTQGFYIENTSEKTEGLRFKCKGGVAWVQYFGPDSHVKTRQSPNPMLLYCNKLGNSYYFKVGFKGIFHLAHACIDGIKSKTADLLWDRAHRQTEKIIGHKLGIKEAAKTTWLK